MHEIVLHSSHDEINFYTWSDNECCLPKGATRATLRNDPNDPQLSITQDDINKGVFLLFEEVLNPETGKEEDADPAHHHVVRLTKIKTKDANSNDLKDPLTGDKIAEIEWHHDDALPFPLCLSARVGTEVKDVSIARGNIVFADHGMSVEYPLFPEEVPKQGSYHARLTKGPLSYKEDFDQTKSAASAVKQNLRKAMPVIELISEGEPWDPKYDLLASDKFAKEFVVEMESDGIAHLRFGDGILGKKPHAGADFTARYRVSNGRAGNVGAETITHIVTDKAGIEQITNPLPAVGGTDPETIEHVRQAAPWAFRTQERAVTPEDYAEVAQRHAEVQRAVATFRWTGSWYTVFLTIDRRNGLPIDDAFEKDIRKHMEKYRMAGYDLEVDSPQFVSLEIEMSVCIKPDYFRSNVNEVLLQVFSNLILPDGQKGIFHPDNFTFGQTVYLSPIYAAAQATEGVDSVKITKFQRQGIKSNDALDAGKLILGRLEIARLDNDPNYPEHGVLSINVEGGK